MLFVYFAINRPREGTSLLNPTPKNERKVSYEINEGSALDTSTFLSFLGVGLSSDVPSLGRLIAKYTNNMSNYPYLFWIPVTVLALVSVSLYIVGRPTMYKETETNASTVTGIQKR